MGRHDHRDRGSRARRPDRAVRARRTGGDRDLAVCRDLAVPNLADGTQRLAGEAGGGEEPVDGGLESAQSPREVGVELDGGIGGRAGIVLRRRAESESQIGEDDVGGAVEDVEAGQSALGHHKKGVADRRGVHREGCVGHGSIISGGHVPGVRGDRAGDRAAVAGAGEEPPIVRRVGNSAKLGGA